MKKRALCPLSGVHLTIKPEVLCERCGENERSSEYAHKTSLSKYKYSGRSVKDAWLRASDRLENVTYLHRIAAFVDVCSEK